MMPSPSHVAMASALNMSTADLSATLLSHAPLIADLFLTPGLASSVAADKTPNSLYAADQPLAGPVVNYAFAIHPNGSAYIESSSLAAAVGFDTKKVDRLVEVPYLFRTMVASIYFITAIFAFIVNLFALLILFFGRRKSRQLNRFLSNLGFSDIIFAIFNIPFTYITLIYNTWWLPEFLCPLTSFVQVLAPTVAFYTLIAIGIGRYFVIVTGHESLLLTKSSNTKVVIISIWVLAVLVASPTLFASKISPVIYENETFVECSEDWSFVNDYTPPNISAGTLYTIVVFVLTFILPVVALTYLYGHIGLIIYKHQLPVGNDNRVTNCNLTQTKIKVVKMLLLLVISFIVCWSPCQIFYLMLWIFEDIRTDSPNYRNYYYTIYFFFHWLSCSHTIINPFIYCFFSNNFQKSDLIAILSCNIDTSSRSRKSISQYPNSANFNAPHRNDSLRGDARRASLLKKATPNDSVVTLKYAAPCSRHSDV